MLNKIDSVVIIHNMDMLNPHIRTFVAIVENGSITAAADKLGLGKSGLSQQLRQLEAILGVKLLTRTTRKQSLTPIGERYFRQCKEIQILAIQSHEDIDTFLQEPSGRLRITAPHAAMRTKIAPAISSLLAAFPKITPDIIIDDQRLDLIENNIDVAITVGDLPDSDYKSLKIGDLTDILCISPIYLQHENLTPEILLDPKQVSRCRYIAHAWQGKNIKLDLVSNTSKRKMKIEVSPTISANNLTAVKALALEGLGLAYLPDFVIEDEIDDGALIRVLPKYAGHTLNIHAVHPYGQYMPLAARTFIEILKQALTL